VLLLATRSAQADKATIERSLADMFFRVYCQAAADFVCTTGDFWP
jgi:hypothetical protein